MFIDRLIRLADIFANTETIEGIELVHTKDNETTTCAFSQ